MSIIKKLNTPFFLTGGTALSRHYFNHRYSDDLDLFVISDPEFQDWIERVLEGLYEAEKWNEFVMERQTIRRLKDFVQIFVHLPEEQTNSLKIDFVNDVAAHYGSFEEHERLGRIDSWRNILSNNISALFRFEPKDIVDIWMLSKKRAFQWQTILEEAKSKEAGVKPEIIYNILRSFPGEKLDSIRWIRKPEYVRVKSDIETIADDLFYGRENSLVEK
ncbi:MAG: nucleotidyl transferase AbiEii/AbiGii toxin family protein [Bacteroidota bacterium]